MSQRWNRHHYSGKETSLERREAAVRASRKLPLPEFYDTGRDTAVDRLRQQEFARRHPPKHPQTFDESLMTDEARAQFSQDADGVT